MNAEQQKVIDRCAVMLKLALKGLKRIVFDLAPDGQEDTVGYEIHGKVNVKGKELKG